MANNKRRNVDMVKLFDFYRIEYKTEGHKHCRPGWINTVCPCCEGTAGYHLGYNLAEEYFVCWRCGYKPFWKILSKLLRIKEEELGAVLKAFKGSSTQALPVVSTLNIKDHKLPSSTSEMAKRHLDYLVSRGFNPRELRDAWHLMGTGPISMLDGVVYANRILAPIFWEGKQVSFQTRDISGRAELRYIACPEEREIIKHKHILYRLPDPPFVSGKRLGIIVEGIADAWRIGRYAAATFGAKYTPEQVLQISKLFDVVVVVYDSDFTGRTQGDKLVAELRFAGIDARREEVAEDPGSLTEAQARDFVGDIIRRYVHN